MNEFIFRLLPLVGTNDGHQDKTQQEQDKSSLKSSSCLHKQTIT